MVPHLLFYQFLLVALVLICLLIHVAWPDDPCVIPQTPFKPDKPRRQRCRQPKLFAGLIHKPLCDTCEQAADSGPRVPGVPGRVDQAWLAQLEQSRLAWAKRRAT